MNEQLTNIIRTTEQTTTTRIEQHNTIPPLYLTNYCYHYPTISTTTRKRPGWFDTFLRNLKHGIESRYPLCCVLDFSLNEVIHRNDIKWIGAAANRPGGGDKEYVLCYIHHWLATLKLKDKPLNFFEQSQVGLFTLVVLVVRPHFVTS